MRRIQAGAVTGCSDVNAKLWVVEREGGDGGDALAGSEAWIGRDDAEVQADGSMSFERSRSVMTKRDTHY